MQEIYCESIRKIMQNKARLEFELDVKLTNKGRIVFIEGNANDEFLALQVLEALIIGFNIDEALELKQDDFMLQTVNIKDITKRNDLERVRARLIGTEGKTITTIENLTSCKLAIHGNKIGIIGKGLEVDDGVQAVKSMIHGSKQGNVYARLEKRRKYKNTKPYDVDEEDLEL
jgi:ribosomal RNA assembly protein